MFPFKNNSSGGIVKSSQHTASISLSKNYYGQVLLVIAVFFVMVFVSCLFVDRVVTNQIDNESDARFDAVKRRVEAIFINYERLVFSIAGEVENYCVHDAPIEEISNYLEMMDRQISSNSIFSDLHCIIEGKIVDIDTQKPFRPSETLFQNIENAIEKSHGELIYLNEIGDLDQNRIVQGKALFITRDGECRPIGGISLAIDFQRAVDYFQISEKGYAFLMSPDMDIAVHHKTHLYRKSLIETSEGGKHLAARIQEEIEKGNFSGRVLSTDSNNIRSVTHYARLKNGWWIIFRCTVDSYYQQVRMIKSVISVLGIFSAGLLCILLRILHRNRVRIQQANEYKTSFIAQVGHEIRTSMNAVEGFSHLILREKKELSLKLVKYSTEINKAAKYLTALINNILDISKIELGQLKTNDTSFKLSALLDEIFLIYQKEIGSKDLQLISFVDPSLPDKLFGDDVHIRQILQNVLSNAVKYTLEGHISVDVVGVKKENTLILTVSVHDTGMGIKEEELDKIFSKFYRGEAGQNSSIDGTGLGLMITRELVLLLDGSIAVTSQYGEGTTFTITLPVEIVDHSPIAVISEPSSLYVLVYEPRTLYDQSLSRILNHLNVKKRHVQNEKEFCEVLQQYPNVTHIFADSSVYSDVDRLLKLFPYADIKIVLICDPFDMIADGKVHFSLLPLSTYKVAALLDEDAYQTKMESTVILSYNMSNARILLVDDNNVNLFLLKSLIEPYGCHTDCVTSGQEALQRMEEGSYDLIFMDHLMPEMDGLETVKRIRKLGKKEGTEYCQNVPIVICTADTMHGIQDRFHLYGIDDYISKPIDLKKLKETLVRWVPNVKTLVEPEDVRPSPKPKSERNLLIPGINTKIGMTRVGGGAEKYTSILELFINEMPIMAKVLEKALQENDLHRYKVGVHSFKNALVTIGANSLSNVAKILETAAHNNDRITIDAHHTGFIRHLWEMIGAMKSALHSFHDNGNSPVNLVSEDKVFLHTELTRLLPALEQMNIRQVDEISDALKEKQWSKETQEHLESIFRHILLFEWDKATAETVYLLEREQR